MSRYEAKKSSDELQAKSDLLNDSLKRTVSELKKNESDLKHREREEKDNGEKLANIDEELEEVMTTLREAKNDKKRGKSEQQYLHAIEGMKRHFPGVRGRLIDLCKPTQKRFNQAVTVAAGKQMDAIVVDDSQIAIQW